jgi:hypothetical protein
MFHRRTRIAASIAEFAYDVERPNPTDKCRSKQKGRLENKLIAPNSDKRTFHTVALMINKFCHAVSDEDHL